MATFLEFTCGTGPKNTAADHDDIARCQRKNSGRLGSIQLVVSVNENDERCQVLMNCVDFQYLIVTRRWFESQRLDML